MSTGLPILDDALYISEEIISASNVEPAAANKKAVPEDGEKKKAKKKKIKICCVRGCINNSSTTATYHLSNGAVTLHAPSKKDAYKRLQWANAVHRPELLKSKRYVCTLHFKPEDFSNPKGKKRTIKYNAVPSIVPDFDLSTLEKPKTPKNPKRKRSSTPDKNRKQQGYASDGYTSEKDASYNSGYNSEGYNYNSTPNKNSSYSDYDETPGTYGEYIPQSYISSGGKRANPLQPLQTHSYGQTRGKHMPGLQWDNEYEVEEQPAPPQPSHRGHSSKVKTMYTPPKSMRGKTMYTMPKVAPGPKSFRGKRVHFEDPIQQTVRELREQQQQQQMQFSLMSMAPIEIDRSSSFTAPVTGEEIIEKAEPETPVTPQKIQTSVDSAIAVEILQKQVELLEQSLQKEKDKCKKLKIQAGSYSKANNNYRQKCKVLLTAAKRGTMVVKKPEKPVKKQEVERVVFNLKDKNIRVIFS